VEIHCTPTFVSITQTNSNDGNNCNYGLDRNGTVLKGVYTCTKIGGHHKFDGTIK
jgi:hypothetical protein